mmetsp:Transcript_11531/g.15947  ORF Transcript_11531/g.15947 Transcript_11531/m.15947 type:complete len:354 (+) Transcript_11531:520-1581(+)
MKMTEMKLQEFQKMGFKHVTYVNLETSSKYPQIRKMMKNIMHKPCKVNFDGDAVKLHNFKCEEKIDEYDEAENRKLKLYFLKCVTKKTVTTKERLQNVENQKLTENQKLLIKILILAFAVEKIDLHVGDAGKDDKENDNDKVGSDEYKKMEKGGRLTDLKIVDSIPSEVVKLELHLKNSILGERKFADLISSESFRKLKELEIRVTVAKAFGMSPAEVVITNVRRGSVIFDLVVPADILRRMAPEDADYQREIATRLGNHFRTHFLSAEASNLGRCLQLSPGDFDSRGDIEFIHPNGSDHRRGNQIYHQPKKGWKRYGLRVISLYEDEDWLKMDGNKGEKVSGLLPFMEFVEI